MSPCTVGMVAVTLALFFLTASADPEPFSTTYPHRVLAKITFEQLPQYVTPPAVVHHEPTQTLHVFTLHALVDNRGADLYHQSIDATPEPESRLLCENSLTSRTSTGTAMAGPVVAVVSADLQKIYVAALVRQASDHWTVLVWRINAWCDEYPPDVVTIPLFVVRDPADVALAFVPRPASTQASLALLDRRQRQLRFYHFGDNQSSMATGGRLQGPIPVPARVETFAVPFSVSVGGANICRIHIGRFVTTSVDNGRTYSAFAEPVELRPFVPSGRVSPSGTNVTLTIDNVSAQLGLGVLKPMYYGEGLARQWSGLIRSSTVTSRCMDSAYCHPYDPPTEAARAQCRSVERCVPDRLPTHSECVCEFEPTNVAAILGPYAPFGKFGRLDVVLPSVSPSSLLILDMALLPVNVTSGEEFYVFAAILVCNTTFGCRHIEYIQMARRTEWHSPFPDTALVHADPSAVIVPMIHIDTPPTLYQFLVMFPAVNQLAAANIPVHTELYIVARYLSPPLRTSP